MCKREIERVNYDFVDRSIVGRAAWKNKKLKDSAAGLGWLAEWLAGSRTDERCSERGWREMTEGKGGYAEGTSVRRRHETVVVEVEYRCNAICRSSER